MPRVTNKQKQLSLEYNWKLNRENEPENWTDEDLSQHIDKLERRHEYLLGSLHRKNLEREELIKEADMIRQEANDARLLQNIRQGREPKDREPVQELIQPRGRILITIDPNNAPVAMRLEAEAKQKREAGYFDD